MKILVVCQLYYPENFVITNIAEKLASFGHDVTVLTGKPNYGYGYILPEYKRVKHEERNGVKIERVKLLPRKKSKISIINNYLSFWHFSRQWVRKTKEQFDVVYSFSLSPVTILSAGNLYKKKHHVKHVVHCVDLWPESVVVTKAVRKTSLFYKILYRWSKKLYSEADEILVGSPSFENYFKYELNLLNKKLTYIPQCSLIEDFGEETYRFDKKLTNIVYCGNIGLLQGVENIPEIAKLVGDNIRFYIIGMGPKEEALKKNIVAYGVAEKVIYLGPMKAKDTLPFINASDALFIALKNEGYVGKTIPNKIMMSMASGKPIIAMISGDGKKVLEEAEGSLISSQNIEEIVEKLNEFTKLSRSLIQKMGDNNKKYYDNYFSLNIISKQIEESLFRNK